MVQVVGAMKDMKRMIIQCPDPEVLSVYLDGGLTSTELTLVEAHLLDCRTCRSIVSAAARAKESVIFPSQTDPS